MVGEILETYGLALVTHTLHLSTQEIEADISLWV